MIDRDSVEGGVARIRPFEQADVSRVVASFAQHGWHKPTETFEGYRAAQRLYVHRGYLPDGRGVMYEYRTVEPGRSIPIDDDATLMMTRVLRD